MNTQPIKSFNPTKENSSTTIKKEPFVLLKFKGCTTLKLYSQNKNIIDNLKKYNQKHKKELLRKDFKEIIKQYKNNIEMINDNSVNTIINPQITLEAFNNILSKTIRISINNDLSNQCEAELSNHSIDDITANNDS